METRKIAVEYKQNFIYTCIKQGKVLFRNIRCAVSSMPYKFI